MATFSIRLSGRHTKRKARRKETYSGPPRLFPLDRNGRQPILMKGFAGTRIEEQLALRLVLAEVKHLRDRVRYRVK